MGVSHSNDDGSSRQKALKKCRVPELLRLEHDEDNAHDDFAVRVLRANGDQLGYLRSRHGEEVVGNSERGCKYAAIITDLTGGTQGKPTRGANIAVVWADPGVSKRGVDAYVQELLKHEGVEATRSGCLGTIAVGIAILLFFAHVVA